MMNHAAVMYPPKTVAQRLITRLDDSLDRCPVDQIRVPRFGAWWFRHGYFKLRTCGKSAVLLESLWVDQRKRGKGEAGRMLRFLAARAAELGVDIWLAPLQFDRGGLSTKQLREWYLRRGFEDHPTIKGDLVLKAGTYAPPGSF